MSSFANIPFLGFGLGLRPEYYQQILEQSPAIDWFEITTENYLVPGGRPHYYLEKFRQNYPLVMHGVSMSLGSTDPLDTEYLAQLKNLANRIEPAWISDHLCWTGIDKLNMHDLLPLPYTETVINHVVARIQTVQEFLGQRIAIENVSSYVTFTNSVMEEWQFISEIINRADCYMLLDINNIYVSAINHNFSALDYLNALPKNRIIQIHLAGHSNYGTHIIDTHDATVIPAVWELYQYALKRFGAISTMIERDDNMPELSELIVELNHARALAKNIGMLACAS